MKYIPVIIWTAALCASPLTTSCLSDDDIPYPNIQANITSFEVEGQMRAAVIDTLKRTVSITLNDSVNPESLHVNRFTLSAGSSLVTDTTVITQGIDLSSPLTLTVKVYREYEWTISSTRNVSYAFAVDGQIGPANIDPEAHTVSAVVSTASDIKALSVTELKLAGVTATYSPSILGHKTDFSSPLKLQVTEYGKTTDWTITITTSDLAVDLTSVDPWTCVAWLRASVKDGSKCRFEYNKAESGSSWIAAPDNWVSTGENGEMICRLMHLDPLTSYVARAVDVSTDVASPEIFFTTGASIQAPNSDFTNWWLDGKVWCPWKNNGDPYWGTGNKGATTLGDSNTTPVTDSNSATGFAGASLETRFVGIGMLGKLAAGNLFSGSYVRTDGTNGVLSFGRPFTERPTALRATIKYSPKTISHSSSDFSALKGRPDTCTVWCALIDSDEPYEIRTKPSDRKLFVADGPEVIAYGQFQSGSEISDDTPIDIPLSYVSTSRVPRYIIIVASASKYGDYFTGGAGSLLLVKSYELLYDYTD